MRLFTVAGWNKIREGIGHVGEVLNIGFGEANINCWQFCHCMSFFWNAIGNGFAGVAFVLTAVGVRITGFEAHIKTDFC